LSDLCRFGPTSASRHAERERLQPQSLTRIIAAPENQSDIERRRNAVDGRELVIVATERGRQALADDMCRRSIWLDRAMTQALSRAEQKNLLAAAPGHAETCGL
jgi:DNA-binding MarR family transcriptional regulator